jgi:hypothetical protein
VVGRTLGWQHVKSTAFDLRKKDGAYRFSGHGSGHGVGLCVIGSARLAERGSSAEAILGRYFPGLEISGSKVRPTSDPDLRTPSKPAAKTPFLAAGKTEVRPGSDVGLTGDLLVSLPDDDEGERDAIVKQTLKARGDLARALGLLVPRVTLRFHPTTDDYERVTGQPWFTSGALVHDELHLLPRPCCAIAECWSGRYATSSYTCWPTPRWASGRRGCAKGRRSTSPASR